MDIGVFGGTFDPIHSGHLVIAEVARLRLGLSQVIFVPAGAPWFKHDRAISLEMHRLEMVKLAAASDPHLRVSTVDLDRAGPSYSVDTLIDLKRELGEEANLFFIVGAAITHSTEIGIMRTPIVSYSPIDGFPFYSERAH